ncbi:MAG: BlaI/MecI/CopY family transcriptional regulator [Gemmatimonadaceae bacterium]|nr:BlaI/MecI/CopY family transcriptional regulator [Gemmatimonadaceae bacterium]
MPENTNGLSRRERQIMDFLFQAGSASVSDVRTHIASPPSYSAVRAMLRTLEEKGHVSHREEGRAYVYAPTVRRDAARKSALSHMLKTFFDDSTENAVAALLDLKSAKMDAAELGRLEQLVKRAKREGR